MDKVTFKSIVFYNSIRSRTHKSHFGFSDTILPALKRNKIIVGISLTFDPIEARNFYEPNLQVLCCLLIFSNRTIYRVVSTYNTIPKVGISFTQ